VGFAVYSEGSEHGSLVSVVNFEYEAAPIISSLSPSKGLRAGGTVVTVQGTRLQTDAGAGVVCLFGGATVDATVVNSTMVVCAAPRNTDAGVVAFGVVRNTDAYEIGGALQYEYYSAPVAEYIWPVKGTLGGGVLMSIHGKGFVAEGLLCRFGSEIVATAKMLSSTMAACMAPAWETTGVVAVEVSLNGGADFSDTGREFTYEVGATVEGLRPSRGEAGLVDDQVVTVMGQHFQATGQFRCRFGQDKTVQGRFLSSTEVVCKAPVRGAGTVSVGVINDGLSASGSALFEYGARRAALSIHPSKGPTEGSTLVTVTGWGPEASVDDVECHFGMRLGTAVAGTAGTVLCASPNSGTVGLVKFVLRKRSEGGEVGTAFDFEYYATPTILDVFPGSGLVLGGTVVTVRGANFGADGLTCRFGALGVTGADARWETSSVVACVSPQAFEEGAVAVEISLNGGVDYTASGKKFVYESNPIVESLNPSWAVAGVAQQVITVVGQHFKQTLELSCRMGVNTTVAAKYVSSSIVKCMAPARGTGTVRVSVSNNGVDAGLSSKQLMFEVGRGILAVTPSRAPAQGGTSVTVSMYGRMQGGWRGVVPLWNGGGSWGGTWAFDCCVCDAKGGGTGCCGVSCVREPIRSLLDRNLVV